MANTSLRIAAISTNTVVLAAVAALFAEAGNSLVAGVLYGVTSTSLVTIDPSTGAAGVVGNLALAAGWVPGPLAWNPEDNQLYGLAYDTVLVGGTPVLNNQRFIRINPSTGAASTVAELGPRTSTVTYDAIEYLAGTVNSLIVSRSTLVGSTSSGELATITTGGALTSFRTTALDNDLLARDTTPSALYSIDPNHADPGRRARAIDTATDPAGVTFLAGSLPSSTTGELAYDLGGGRLYALDYTPGNRSLYRLNTGGGTSLALEDTVTVADAQVLGIAFTAIPEPAEWGGVVAVLLGGWATLRRRREPVR